MRGCSSRVGPARTGTWSASTSGRSPPGPSWSASSDGLEVGTGVHAYRHGVIDERLPISGEDAAAGLGAAGSRRLRGVARRRGPCRRRRHRASTPPTSSAIATDFTACTMVPTLRRRDAPVPVARVQGSAARLREAVAPSRRAAPGRSDQPASRPNARSRGSARYGGLISSEWEFAKGLELLEDDGEVYRTMDRWVEAADWIVWQLCGRYVRNTCSAGYKGIRQDGAYPSADYLARAQPGVRRLRHRRSSTSRSVRSARPPERSPPQAAERTGLPEGIVVAVGNVDAHVTAPAARAVEPGRLVAIMGTSTCHVVNGTSVHDVPGHVRRRRRGHRRRKLGVRGRPERRRRPVRAGAASYGVPAEYERAADGGRDRSARVPQQPGGRASRSASTVCSPSTGSTATARCS